MDWYGEEMEDIFISSENEDHSFTKEIHKDKELNSIKFKDFEKINTSICK